MTLRLESSGERLDAALARLVPELSRKASTLKLAPAQTRLCMSA